MICYKQQHSNPSRNGCRLRRAGCHWRLASAASAERSGFTLVELLVSTGLVVLMMLMFATIFQLAAGSMTTQRGIAENDQRARTLTTIIKADLDRRTFVDVIPYANDPGLSGTPAYNGVYSDRRGYFYISENDPDIDSDDVLAFTVEDDAEEYVGLGTILTNADLDPGPPLTTNYLTDRNQPDWDDGQPNNNLGDSPAAEVVYFLRNGNLYRRVMLLREELNGVTPSGPQPQKSGPVEFFRPDTNYVGDFWRNYDYSAHNDTSGITGTVFNARNPYLGNNTNPTGIGLVEDFGHPFWRFGHDHGTGQSLEFINGNFIGRYTHEETSHDDFNYPHAAANVAGGINPMLQAAANANLTIGADGVVDQFRGGPRRAEDILMSNVHSFDVKVWDQAIAKFVDIGHSEVDAGSNPVGFFNQANNLHVAGGIVYGSSTTAANNRVFDTWHPHLDLSAGGNASADHSNSANSDPPPFRMISSSGGSDGQPGDATVDDDGANGIDDAGELGFPGTDDELPLRAILITIRFLDTGSDQLRQLTIMHSLVD